MKTLTELEEFAFIMIVLGIIYYYVAKCLKFEAELARAEDDEVFYDLLEHALLAN